MTTDELEALEPGTTIYLPIDWEVTVWLYAGKVPNRNFYTLLHPPDADGTTNNRRPVYVDIAQILPACLEEQSAWLAVLAGLSERIEWIYKRKLNHD